MGRKDELVHTRCITSTRTSCGCDVYVAGKRIEIKKIIDDTTGLTCVMPFPTSDVRDEEKVFFFSFSRSLDDAINKLFFRLVNDFPMLIQKKTSGR